MICKCRPWAEIRVLLERDAVACGLQPEQGESALMQLRGKGCVVECREHAGRFLVNETVRLVMNARQAAVTCPVCRGGWLTEISDDEEAVDRVICRLCDGTTFVTYAQLAILEARLHVQMNEPTWTGDDVLSPVLSLAKWADLRRQHRGRLRGAQGTPISEPPGWLVQLLDGTGPVAEFHGVAWGYQGGGPRALAAILVDALPDVFVSFDAAIAFIEAQPKDEAWELVRT